RCPYHARIDRAAVATASAMVAQQAGRRDSQIDRRVAVGRTWLENGQERISQQHELEQRFLVVAVEIPLILERLSRERAFRGLERRSNRLAEPDLLPEKPSQEIGT